MSPPHTPGFLSPHRTSTRRIALVLFAGLSLGIAGCERDTSASLALKKAESEIRGLIPGREHVPHQQVRDTTYGNVLTTLRPVLQNGTETQKATAAAMIAQAHAGLAEAPAAEASQREIESHAAAIRLRAAHTHFLTQSAKAEAAAGYDSRPELEGIEAQVRTLDQEQRDLEQKKAQIDQQVQQLRTQAADLMAQARKKREEAATIKGRIPNETATRGEELMQQAYAITRDADALELQAATLDAQAAKVQPDSEQAQLDIERVHNQKALLDSAREQVQSRHQARREEAATARAAANKVADEIKELVRTIDSMRSGELSKAWEEAAQNYQQAATSARQSASRGSKGSAFMAVGSYQQSLGDLYWTRAQGQEDWATILEALATSEPPVSADFQTLATNARASAKDYLDQATEAYIAANEAYQNAGGSGEAAQHIQRINEILRRGVQATSGGSRDIEAFVASAAGAGDEFIDGEAAPMGGTSPNDTLAALNAMAESGDFRNLAEYVVVDTPEQQQLLDFSIEFLPPIHRLQRAMQQKFGEEGTEAITAMKARGGFGSMLGTDFATSEDLEFEVEGDVATAWDDGAEVQMRLVDGIWKLEMRTSGALPAEAYEAMAKVGPAMARAIDSTASDVEAGKFSSAAEVSAVVIQKLMEATMREMGGPGGFPGGGG
jgi:hypothetical protein